MTAAPSYAQAAVGSAAVDTWYVRPASACTFNGDGLSYGCAASAGAAGAFNALSNIIWTVTTGVDDGDTLYICGVQRGDRIILGSAGGASESARITISWSCPGDPGTIRATTDMSEALISGNWTNEGGNLWYLSVASYTGKDPVRVWFDGVPQFPSNNKANLGTTGGTGQGPLGIWWYDSANSRLYLYSTINPASTFSSLESLVYGVGSCRNAAICGLSASNIYLDFVNPVIQGGAVAGFRSSGGSYIRIYGTTTDRNNCQFSDVARGIAFTDSDGIGTGSVGVGNQVYNCTFNQSIPVSHSAYWWEYGYGWGDGVDLKYGVTNSVIYNNTFTNFAHTAVEILANAGTTSVTGNVIRNNTFTCESHVPYCRAYGTDGVAIGRASNNLFYSNTINNMATRTQINGDANTVTSNLFLNQRQNGLYLTRTESIELQGYAGPSQNNIFANNTFYSNPFAPCISFRSDTGTKSGNIIANNILIDCGGASYTSGYENVAVSIPVAVDIGNNTFKNNAVYSSAQTNTVYYKATGKTTIAGFQSACSGDTCTSNLTSNPLTISSTDMNLQPLSPAIDAGTSAATSTDYAGNPIYGTPDIGAYEYQPPYTFASNNIPTTGSTRLYSDGKYRMVTATSSASTGVFSVKPSSGSYLATTTQYMDITIDSWLTTGTKNKQWTATSTAGSFLTQATSTLYTIGDLLPSSYYIFKVDSTASSTAITNNSQCTAGVCLSNSSGTLTFTYTGGYSTHTFDLTKDAFALSSPSNNAQTSESGTIALSWTGSTKPNLSYYQLYIDGSLTTNTIASTTLSVSAPSTLSCNQSYSWYLKAIDTAGNATNSDTRHFTRPCGAISSTASYTPPLAIPTPTPVPTLATTATSTTPTVPTKSSGLSSAQIQAILSLLTSFGADASVIQNVTASLQGSPISTAVPSPFFFTRNLSLNQASEDVKKLQQFLNTHGFIVASTGPGSSGNESTLFGTRTYTALIKFQKSRGLPATGWFGPLTRAVVNE